jgi:phosphoglycolate phosphatase-like HAD superfamily hydrolase
MLCHAHCGCSASTVCMLRWHAVGMLLAWHCRRGAAGVALLALPGCGWHRYYCWRRCCCQPAAAAAAWLTAALAALRCHACCCRSGHLTGRLLDAVVTVQIFTNFGVGPFPQEWFGKWVGRSAPSLGAQMLEDYPTEITISAAELVEQKEAAFTRMARDPDGPMQSVVFEGLADSLKALGDHHVPIALCTSAFRVSSTAVLEGTQLAQFFSADRRTTIDDVENAKPDPEPCPSLLSSRLAPLYTCTVLHPWRLMMMTAAVSYT